MAKTPYARTETSEKRESKMRAAAPEVLRKAGYQILKDRKSKGMQLLDALDPNGKPLIAWVKCAWKPGTHDTCAVQIDFPGPENRATDMKGVIRVVTEKAARAAAQGATHIFLYAADDNVSKSLAAYLLPLSQIEQVTREAIDIAPNLVKNGYSPSLYIYAKSSPKDKIVEVVKRHSTDLLANAQPKKRQSTDAINDLDQIPAGTEEPSKITSTSTAYQRDPAVREFVLKRAAGKCEYCGQLGFQMENGERYLEAHHIVSLAKQGPDTVVNVIALCANHHRQAHYGDNRLHLEKEMQVILRKLNKMGNH